MLSEIGTDYKFSVRDTKALCVCVCVRTDMGVTEKGSGLQDACSPISH